MQTTRADAHEGGTKPGVPVHVLLPLNLCASPKKLRAAPPTSTRVSTFYLHQVLWQKLTPVRGNIVCTACILACTERASAHGCKPPTYACRRLNIWTNCKLPRGRAHLVARDQKRRLHPGFIDPSRLLNNVGGVPFPVARLAAAQCPGRKEEGHKRPLRTDQGEPGGVTRHGPLSFAWA